MLFITTYHSPDIDGIACCLGYGELLKKLSTEPTLTYYGDFSREVEFVKNYTHVFPLIKHEGKYPKDAEFILVDTADPEAVEPTISAEKVKEIFDHRELVFTGKFVNAKLNIEKVGSCATLITELFQKNKLSPSKEVATYLYSAIISNTVRFKNTVTTPRDIAAADWLKAIAKVDDHYIEAMFEYKSKIENTEDLIFLLDQDYATHNLNGKNVMIAQVEIAKLEAVVAKYRADIQNWLREMMNKEKLDYVLFTGIDIVRGFNIFITVDDASNTFFSKVLAVPQIGKGYKTKDIIMRKQIWPKVDKQLTKI